MNEVFNFTQNIKPVDKTFLCKYFLLIPVDFNSWKTNLLYKLALPDKLKIKYNSKKVCLIKNNSTHYNLNLFGAFI